MGKWIDRSDDERLAIIQKVALEKQIDDVAAEKDWWVTMVLYALFHTKYAKYLLFKGGTSLSKGWKLISRFSEDIDIAFSRNYFTDVVKWNSASFTNNTQQKKFKEECQDFFWGEFQTCLEEELKRMGFEGKVQVKNTNQEYIERGDKNEKGEQKKVDHDADPSVINVYYTSLFESDNSEYTIPRVKIEISALSMEEPYEDREITSLISEVYAKDFPDLDSDYTQTIKTVSPTRTFLEKVFLLCEEPQKKNPRTYRMSRHLYDLWKLKGTAYYKEALNNPQLYLDVIRHRKKMYHIGAVDYNKDLPTNVTVVPPENMLDNFEADYIKMQDGYIYDDSPTFEELCKQLKAIENDLRKVEITEEL